MHCEPRIRVVPPSVRNAGAQITAIAGKAGIALDEVQQQIVSDISGVGRDGRWAAYQSVIMQPRQNGKSEVLIVMMLAGLFVFGDRQQVYSSHQSRTSSKVFRRLRRAIESSPELGGRIVRVSNRTGAESIELSTGQIVEFVARSTSSGRGFTGDTILVDEAHQLDAESLAASLPMLATRPNGRAIYGLSMGNEDSSHLGYLRAQALDRLDDRLCWLEWSMGEGDRVDDPAVWRKCNPAHPGRISLDAMKAELAALGVEQFARERLGKSNWPQDESGRFAVISKEAWLACAVPGAEIIPPVCLGVAVSRDGRTAAICGCYTGADGLPVVELADYRSDGAGWVGPRLKDLTGRHQTASVCWDDDSLCGPLGLAGYTGRARCITPKPGELAQACSSFMYEFEDRAARHTGDQMLTAAVGAARVRPSRAAWYWDDRAFAAEVLQAATWALHASRRGVCPYDLLRSVA